MPMKMQAMIVFVDVSVSSGDARVAGCEFFTEPLHGAGQIESAEKNQHQAYGKFHGETGAGRDDYAEKDDGAANDGDGQRVTATPEDADEAGFGDGAFAADDGGNGNDVIRIGGVAHPEEEADGENGETAGQ